MFTPHSYRSTIQHVELTNEQTSITCVPTVFLKDTQITVLRASRLEKPNYRLLRLKFGFNGSTEMCESCSRC